MPNAYTDSTALSNVVQTAYDKLIEFALRAQPLFRDLADKRPEQPSMAGASIVLNLYNDLSPATGTLAETTDPDSVAIPNTTPITLTVNEYGSPVLATRKLRLTAFSDVDPAVVDLVAFNMIDSLDVVAQNVLRGGPNFIREAGGARSTSAAITAVLSTDTIKSRDIRLAVTKLRAGKAQPRKGELYYAGIHPEVSHDLREETGASAWRDPHVYSAPSSIWAGEIGQYEGAFFVETPRAYNAVDGGSGGNTVRVFRTYVAGKQAFAESTLEEPHIVFGNVTDKLMRFRPVGWYGVLGWARYRDAALWRIETTSSVNSS